MGEGPIQQYENYSGGQTPKRLAYVSAMIQFHPGFDHPFDVEHFEDLEVRIRQALSEGLGLRMDDVDLTFEEYVEADPGDPC